MKTVRVMEKSADIDSLNLHIGAQDAPAVDVDECLVRVVSAAVSPSDVKAVPAFERGTLKPFPIVEDFVFDLSDAALAYQGVFRGAANRVLLKP